MELALDRPEEETLAEHSQLYCGLRRFVEEAYTPRGYPEGMRLLIFSVAYTYLSHQKKSYIARNLISNTFAPGSKAVKEVFREFARQEKYEEACEYALDHLVAISDAASNEVIKKITSEVGQKFDLALAAHLPTHPPSNTPGWLRPVLPSLNFLILDPGRYAIRVILAGFLVALLLAALNLLAPPLTAMLQASARDFVVHYVLGGKDPLTEGQPPGEARR